jgi:hypothetical protein
MNFGKWILVAFVLFTVFIGTLVTVCVREDISLVSKSYYQEELVHQTKIEKIQNTMTLTTLPEIQFRMGQLQIVYPDFNKLEAGSLKLLRPSDARLDQSFNLQAISGSTQQFELPVWDKGLYRATMQWTMEGKEYYLEKLIVL